MCQPVYHTLLRCRARNTRDRLERTCSGPSSATDQLGDLAQVAVLEETSKMVPLYCSYVYKALYKHIIGIIITNSVPSKRLYLWWRPRHKIFICSLWNHGQKRTLESSTGIFIFTGGETETWRCCITYHDHSARTRNFTFPSTPLSKLSQLTLVLQKKKKVVKEEMTLQDEKEDTSGRIRT